MPIDIEENRSIQEICDDLSNNFLFQASLGSKELFHSNMLAWLLEQPNDKNKLEALKLFANKVLEKDSFPEIDFAKDEDQNKREKSYSIKREEHKIDITIKWKDKETNKFIYIENKMKSIPTKEQLEEYNYKIGDDNNTIKLILTPFKSSNSKEFKILGWANITYEKHIIPFLEECKKINFYSDEEKIKKDRIRMFIQAYEELLSKTLEICKKLNINNEEELLVRHYDFYNSNNNELEKLKKIRFDDFILKLVHENIAKTIKQKIEDENNITIIRGDFSRTEGITDIKVLVQDEKKYKQYIILQLQGLSLRYGTEVIFDKKMKKEKSIDDKVKKQATNVNVSFANELYIQKIWFLEDRKNEKLLSGKGRSENLKINSTEKNSFNSFTNDTFIYMNRKIHSFQDKNISELINLIIIETQYVIDEINKGSESKIKKIYENCK